MGPVEAGNVEVVYGGVVRGLEEIVAQTEAAARSARFH